MRLSSFPRPSSPGLVALLATGLLWACAADEPTERRAPDRAHWDRPLHDDTDDDTDEPVPLDDHACYLGEHRDHTTCLALVVPELLDEGYDYPSPMGGSPQYREPVAYLDLYAYPGSTLVAPNFRLDELAQDWKGRYAVVQTHAVDHLQGLRDALGPIVVNSGYRNVTYNAQVGGATWSRHMYGDAFDMRALDASLTALRDACNARGAGYVAVYTNHVHCDWRHDPLDTAFYGDPPSARPAALAAPHHTVEVLWRDGALEADATGFECGEPLREWTARDARGRVLHHATVERFYPPAGAHEVTVRVAQRLEHRVLLP